jgi:hypothetical protein
MVWSGRVGSGIAPGGCDLDVFLWFEFGVVSLGAYECLVIRVLLCLVMFLFG